LRTTTRSSDRRSRCRGTGPLFKLALGVLFGCATPTDPATLFQLAPESAAHRAAETRRFETADEAELLSASAAALQDLGFQVTECTRELGFLRAAKERSARERGQEIVRWLVALVSSIGLVSGSNTLVLLPVDLQQQINASLSTRRVEDGWYDVRIHFYRIVWRTDGMSGNQTILPGEQRLEVIRDPFIYQRFFSKLSKAVFLEAHKI
jgi:hypothetical protein